MFTGHVMGTGVDSLQAFWPALQVLSGDVPNAIELHSNFFNVWKRYGFLPETFSVNAKHGTAKYI